MTKAWKYQQPLDQLRIFVSSRIDECKTERTAVRDAIRALQHQPILFESVGARPYPPRDLYLSRLSESHAMVAIYRAGYGYIDAANGMSISGLEDEYRFAKQEGIETLVYVWRTSDGREPRLAALIAEIATGPTIGFYEEPEQLEEFVKRDLTALITTRFLAASALRGVLQEDSRNVLSRILNRVGVVVLRKSVTAQIQQRTTEAGIVCIYGPAGIGKTTVSAQYAQEVQARFVRVSGLAPKEIFSVCAGIVRADRSHDAASYSTLEGARLGLAAAWAETPIVVLVVDECDFISELIAALSAGGGFTDTKRLIYTSRSPSASHSNVEVPVLTRSEIDQILATSPLAGNDDILALEGATPLDIQHALLQGASPNCELAAIELRGSAGEVLKYLALAISPLSAEDLLELRADDSYSIDSLADDIVLLGDIVEDSPRGYRVIDAVTASNVACDLKRSPQRHKFFLNRLIRLAERNGTLRHAYELARLLGDGSERKFITGAVREAAQLGDWHLAVSLIDELLVNAVDTDSKTEAFHLTLSLVYPLELMGDVDRASEALSKARQLALPLGDAALLRWEESAVSAKARRALAASDVKELQGIYDRYGDQGRIWDQARLGLELSAIYLAAKRHQEAVRILRPTLNAFNELGDDYGIDLSERNLASALSGLPEGEEEAERLVASISARSQSETDTRRQRAWLCNILTRRLRASGRYAEAEALAKEAIDLATQLGDESLQAINLVNLGNVYRDQKVPAQAINAYEAAAVAGRKCGRLDIEADASRLVAGVLNDFEESGASEERHRKAAMYAQAAIGLLRGSVYDEAQARAWLELAEARESLGMTLPAIEAAFEAASAFRREGDDDSFGRTLNYAIGMALPQHVESYLKYVGGALGLSTEVEGKTEADQFIALISSIVERAPRGGLITALSAHLGAIWSRLPILMKRGLAATSVEILRDFANGPVASSQAWRVLYAGIALASILKSTSNPYLHHRLADSVTRNVGDIFFREDGTGSRVWTVVLSIKRRVALTILPLDDSPASNLACFVLAVFVKAFEAELSDELIGGETQVDELMLQVASFDRMPEEMRTLASELIGLAEMLSTQACAVSRPSNFTDTSPTFVFLASDFLEQVSVRNEGGSALEQLLGLTLTELTFQLLRGQVEMDAIRPKIVSLVRRARP